MPKPKVIGYFEGEEFWTAFDWQYNEYAGPGKRLRILKDGKKLWVQVVGPDGIGGDPLDNSHPCPGSPGCP